MDNKVIMRVVSAVVGGGVVGLILGYVFFGKVAGDYISLGTLFSSSSNVFEKAARSMTGIAAARSKIFTCGGIGALVGLVVGMLPVLKK